ncbi:hypothetical protein EYF88_12270 [Paracoccus sediminis]|uniref:D-galactarate dehydratase n=1 Tax=Paracoccus sediminis TaxID=1214787 RepID=A0A238X0P7_9RHOB|nr:hypothetical protein [Paracoccus sediminis]TBN49341.1 hypothetical protein EYF88_12270 [Paracoccus sediminis]SNR52397.1 hypothetical protein SAMN06265378_10740 [Paracoccus sediminis]
MRMTTAAPAMILAATVLAGCTPGAMTTGRTDAPAAAQTRMTGEQVAAAAAITRAPAPRPAARATAAQLDTTTPEQRAAAAQPAPAAETRLGTTIASLGNPSEGGFWIKTPLVSERGIGRIVNPATGKSAKVDLIPLDGPASGGSQVSLSALQLLGVSLTDLPTIEVYRS